MVTIQLDTVEEFHFMSSGLCYDYLCEEIITHFFHTIEEGRQPRPVLAAKLPELGIGNFCLMMSCQISRSSSTRTGIWLKYTVIYIFPEQKEKMLQHYEMAKSPG
jgi:hypothetical protein